MVEAKRNIPTILVIFGVTGDLVEKKIIPALLNVFSKGELPEMFKVVGLSRRNLSDTEIKEYVSGILVKQSVNGDQKEFLNLFSYSPGHFDNAQDYKRLNSFLRSIDDFWGVCSNKIFYFPVPPKYYESIFENISLSGLSEPRGPDGGWTKVLVEKPFGRDLRSAEKVNQLIGQSFNESQIYRLDHYTGQEERARNFEFENGQESLWGKLG